MEAAGPAPYCEIAIFLAMFDPHVLTNAIVVMMVAVFAASVMALDSDEGRPPISGRDCHGQQFSLIILTIRIGETVQVAPKKIKN